MSCELTSTPLAHFVALQNKWRNICSADGHLTAIRKVERPYRNRKVMDVWSLQEANVLA